MSLDNIVFDTSALKSENFPDLSAAFRKFVDVAKILKIQLFIPDIVVKELEKNYLDCTSDSFNKIKTEQRKLKKVTQEKVNILLPDIETLKMDYKKEVESILKNNNLIVIPMPTLRASALVDQAVQHIPPFERNDKGFRDAMIVESIIEFGLNSKLNKFTLVAIDNIFKSAEIVTAVKKKKIVLKVEKRVDDVSKAIFKLLSKVQKEILKEEEREAIEFLNDNKSEINEYLKNNFEMTEYDFKGLLGTPLKVLDVEIVKIEGAVIEKKETVKTGISFDGEVELKVLIKRFVTGTRSQPKRFKVGEESEEKPKGLYEAMMSAVKSGFYLEPVEIKHNLKVKGEIEADKIGDNYTNFKILYIRPEGQSNFEGLGYLQGLY